MTAKRTKIIDAYETALDGRDPKIVDFLDLLPAIRAAVPAASNDEIADAIEWLAEPNPMAAYVTARRLRTGRKFETCERMKPVFADLDAKGWNDWPPSQP